RVGGRRVKDAIACYRFSQGQRRALALTEQGAGSIGPYLTQQAARQQRLPPAMATLFDAPAAPTQLGRELADEKLQPRVELGGSGAPVCSSDIGGNVPRRGRSPRRGRGCGATDCLTQRRPALCQPSHAASPTLVTAWVDTVLR